MITYKDTTHVFGYALPGMEHKRGRRVIPLLATDGTVSLEAGDGTDLIRVPVPYLMRHVAVLADGADLMAYMKAAARPQTLFAHKRFELIVTDSRLILLDETRESDNSRIAGQIRFPWIRGVSFRPKQSLLLGSEIVLRGTEQYDVEGFPVREKGTFQHDFTLMFDKRYHPGELAREISRRIACHLVDKQRVPRSERFGPLSEAPLLPDPPKGDHASYWMPAYCAFPGGDFGIENDVREPEWIEQNV